MDASTAGAASAGVFVISTVVSSTGSVVSGSGSAAETDATRAPGNAPNASNDSSRHRAFLMTIAPDFLSNV